MSYVPNSVETTTFTRSNKKPEENFTYKFAAQKHRVDVTRSDGKKHTFCVGDTFITRGGKEMTIEWFDPTSSGVYGKGSGTDVSLANQIDKL